MAKNDFCMPRGCYLLSHSVGRPLKSTLENALLGVVVGIFSVIWAIATFRSKSFAAVAGGIGVINTLFSR